jgi:hypothetical protein
LSSDAMGQIADGIKFALIPLKSKPHVSNHSRRRSKKEAASKKYPLPRI